MSPPGRPKGEYRSAQHEGGTSPERRRLSHALLLSLLIHTLLLNLVFDGRGTGPLGFRFPWQDRRIEAPDLRLVLVPAQVAGTESAVAPAAEPLLQAWVEQQVAGGPALKPSVAPARTPGRTAAAMVPKTNLRAEADRRTDTATGVAPRSRHCAPIGLLKACFRR